MSFVEKVKRKTESLFPGVCVSCGPAFRIFPPSHLESRTGGQIPIPGAIFVRRRYPYKSLQWVVNGIGLYKPTFTIYIRYYTVRFTESKNVFELNVIALTGTYYVYSRHLGIIGLRDVIWT